MPKYQIRMRSFFFEKSQKKGVPEKIQDPGPPQKAPKIDFGY